MWERAIYNNNNNSDNNAAAAGKEAVRYTRKRERGKVEIASTGRRERTKNAKMAHTRLRERERRIA